jgi:hypothetical protein
LLFLVPSSCRARPCRTAWGRTGTARMTADSRSGFLPILKSSRPNPWRQIGMSSCRQMTHHDPAAKRSTIQCGAEDQAVPDRQTRILTSGPIRRQPVQAARSSTILCMAGDHAILPRRSPLGGPLRAERFFTLSVRSGVLHTGLAPMPPQGLCRHLFRPRRQHRPHRQIKSQPRRLR